MTQQSIAYYILCRDQGRINQWEARAGDIPDVEFHFCTGFHSMYEFIQKAIEDCSMPFLVIAHDDVIVGWDFARRVRSLVNELDMLYPNWGVVGNAGMDTEGRTYVYVKDPWCVPQPAQGPNVVACIDGNLMLVNRRRYVEVGFEYPDLGGFHGYDLVFSFECLRKGLMVLADGRLCAVHLSGGSRGIYEEYIKSSVFQSYFRERFSDHCVPTMMGIKPVLDWSSEASLLRPSLRNLQDSAFLLAKGGQHHRLAIIDCRLDTAIPLPVEMPLELAPLLEIVKVAVCAEDAPVGAVKGENFLSVPVGSSTGFIVQEAFRCLQHTHFWFITETIDFKPEALAFVARALACQSDSLVIGAYSISLGGGKLSSEQNASTLMRAIFKVEHFPLSALFIPVRPLREAVLKNTLGQRDVDGALLGALVLTITGVRIISMSERIIETKDSSAVGKSNSNAYGKDADWEYVERVALFDSIVSQTNSALWTLAKEASLAEQPSSVMRSAQDVELVWRAVRQVMSNPGSYLKRGLSLAVGYLIRGDIQGLIREARLFRPR